MYIFISLIVTLISYLFIPITYRYTKGKVSKKIGNRIALINSILFCSLFCLFRAAFSDGEIIVSSFAPAITYYFISKWILIDKNIPDEIETEDDEDLEERDENSSVAENTNVNTDEKVKYCFNCGCKLLKNSNYCQHCGKHIKK